MLIDRQTLTYVLVNQNIGLIYRTYPYTLQICSTLVYNGRETQTILAKAIVNEIAYANYVYSSELINFEFLHKR